MRRSVLSIPSQNKQKSNQNPTREPEMVAHTCHPSPHGQESEVDWATERPSLKLLLFKCQVELTLQLNNNYQKREQI